MDIYEYAESINYNADYYDMHTGRIYHIQEYGKALKEMNSGIKQEANRKIVGAGIKVSEDGVFLGYARRHLS